MVFPVVMYGCESWMIKKTEFKELMLSNCGAGEDLRVPWTERRSNQSIQKEINSDYSVERLMFFRIDWLDLLALQGLSRVISDITVQKIPFFCAQLSL